MADIMLTTEAGVPIVLVKDPNAKLLVDAIAEANALMATLSTTIGVINNAMEELGLAAANIPQLITQVPVQVVPVTASRALTTEDEGKMLVVNSPLDIVLTAPTGLTLWRTIMVLQVGVGLVNFQAANGATIESFPEDMPWTAGRNSLTTLLVKGENSYLLRGDVEP